MVRFSSSHSYICFFEAFFGFFWSDLGNPDYKKKSYLKPESNSIQILPRPVLMCF